MNRGPSAAELDALTAWWMSKRHIGRAAKILDRSRQTVANHLQALKRIENAADSVEVALNHLDDIERRWPAILERVA